jgi:hypothetical protein
LRTGVRLDWQRSRRLCHQPTGPDHTGTRRRFDRMAIADISDFRWARSLRKSKGPYFVIDPATGCWVWQKALQHTGYGHTTFVGRGISVMAHRFYWELVYGPLAPGIELDHLCHNADPSCAGGSTCLHRRCVNPAHLDPVSSLENLRRTNNWAYRNPLATHCPQGHSYDEENTWTTKQGWRHCRTCHRERMRAIRARRREAA